MKENDHSHSGPGVLIEIKGCQVTFLTSYVLEAHFFLNHFYLLLSRLLLPGVHPISPLSESSFWVRYILVLYRYFSSAKCRFLSSASGQPLYTRSCLELFCSKTCKSLSIFKIKIMIWLWEAWRTKSPLFKLLGSCLVCILMQKPLIACLHPSLHFREKRNFKQGLEAQLPKIEICGHFAFGDSN